MALWPLRSDTIGPKESRVLTHAATVNDCPATKLRFDPAPRRTQSPPSPTATAPPSWPPAGSMVAPPMSVPWLVPAESSAVLSSFHQPASPLVLSSSRCWAVTGSGAGSGAQPSATARAAAASQVGRRLAQRTFGAGRIGLLHLQ
ncbi:MAG: hypothetical protein MUC69_00865 [Gemmatimonadales bacterium]|nr:hypothetical protein [Gemmatimonadales bacterium]